MYSRPSKDLGKKFSLLITPYIKKKLGKIIFQVRVRSSCLFIEEIGSVMA